MIHPPYPRIGLAALLLALASSLHAQTLDWGAWDNAGNGIYANGDAIAISSLVNGSVVANSAETTSAHLITDPAFPYANAPGIGEVGFFHNEQATNTDWSILIDLSGFTMNADTVIGFSNLDGRGATSPTSGYATIQFLDSSNNPVSVSSASFLGSYDVNWQGITWDANSSFNLNTGRWDVIANSGSTHPSGSYYAAVGDAFFLTDLPTTVDRIVYTKSGATNYVYDSTLFYAGQAVPEPSPMMLGALATSGFLLRRRRG